MEKLAKKYNNLVKIHHKLAEAIEKYKETQTDVHADVELIELIRDSLIKRFELAYDLLWKYLREYLIVSAGVLLILLVKYFKNVYL